jgi:hypothetical protein
VENTLAEERTACSTVAHPLDELELVHFSLDDPIAGWQGEASFDGLFVSYHSSNKTLELADMAFFDAAKPTVELLACPYPEHLSELLDPLIRLIDFSMQRTQQRQRFLFVSPEFFRLAKEKEHRLSSQHCRTWKLIGCLMIVLSCGRRTSPALLAPFWKEASKPPIH